MASSHVMLNALLAQRAEDFCRRYLSNGRKDGHEWRVGDVMGSPGGSLGVQLTGERAGLWNDRACDDGGKLLDILKAQNCGDYAKAADEARRFLGLPEFRPDASRNGNHVFDPLKHPFQRSADSPKQFPVAAWAYHTREGVVAAYACRFEERKQDGSIKKDVLPLRLIEGHWRWKGWTGDELRPLYGLHRLAQRQDATVLIVEGEKTADAAQRLFPDLVCITWQGGSKAVSKVDLSPLIGSQQAQIPGRATPIVLWPDADAPGHAAMLYLKARIPRACLVKLPKTLPDGWDLADPVPDDVSPHGLLDAALNPEIVAESSAPFRLLGFDEANYFYGSNITGVVTAIEAHEHQEMTLQRIAPDEWWADHYPPTKGSSSTADYRAAAKDLISRQHRVGFFDSDFVRGLGCWMDDGRVVFHCGDRLFINGTETALHKYAGKFLYPRRKQLLHLDLSKPLESQDMEDFFALLMALRWQDPHRWWFLSGWLVCSLLCGVLPFRPHLWLLGPARAGKSWIYEAIMGQIASWSLKVLSSTSAAGIRQKLGCDAISLMFDELENIGDASQRRHVDVYELMRQSSSETGGSIIKGTTTGHAMSFRIRSCFAFCSIAMGARDTADESRITRMELLKPIPSEFDHIKSLWRVTAGDPSWCARFRARAIIMAPVVRASVDVLTPVIAKVAGDSRTGQQYGAIAAGHWSLISDSAPSEEEAERWASGVPWQSVATDTEDGDDASRCLAVLLEAKIDSGNHELLSVGELLKVACNDLANTDRCKDAKAALMRHGIHVTRDGQFFDVANRHQALATTFRGTPFVANWRDHLSRLEGADGCVYTPPGGATTRAVRIPRSLVSGLNPTETD